MNKISKVNVSISILLSLLFNACLSQTEETVENVNDSKKESEILRGDFPAGIPITAYLLRKGEVIPEDSISLRTGDFIDLNDEGSDEYEIVVKGTQCVGYGTNGDNLQLNWGKWIEIADDKSGESKEYHWKNQRSLKFKDHQKLLLPSTGVYEVYSDKGEKIHVDCDRDEVITENEEKVEIVKSGEPSRFGASCGGKSWDHCWDANEVKDEIIIDLGRSKILPNFGATLQGAYIFDGAFHFETPSSAVYLGEYSLGQSIEEGMVEIALNFKNPEYDKYPQVVLGDEGRRMTLYRTKTGLSWFKNNDDLIQRLDAKIDFVEGLDAVIQLKWGLVGMSITVDGKVIAENTLTTPAQRSTRDWPDENKWYLGFYDFGTVRIEEEFVVPQTLNAAVSYVAVKMGTDNDSRHPTENTKYCPDSLPFMHCYDYQKMTSQGMVDLGADKQTAILNEITILDSGLAFEKEGSSIYLGDYFLGLEKAEGTIHLNLLMNNRVKLPQVILGDEGRRMTLYRTPEGLSWFKNNDNLLQRLDLTYEFDNKEYELELTWGSDGMRLFVNGDIMASNSFTSPYQRSTRNWASENKEYVGLYDFGTVAVEPEFRELEPFSGLFKSLWVK